MAATLGELLRMARTLAALLALVAAVSLVSAPHAARSHAAKQYVAPAGSGTLFLISGHGYGHGVGMGQWGAEGYALHGYTYDQILAAYYSGTTLSQTKMRRLRVLLADGDTHLTVSSDQPIAVGDGDGVTHTFPAGDTKLTTALPYPAPLTLSPATDAWGGSAPYLVSVKDPYDTVSPWHSWGPIPVTGEDLSVALGLSGKPIDATVTRNGSKRVVQLHVTTRAHGSESDASSTGTA